MLNVNNFAFSTLYIGISDTDTELILQPGDGLLFPAVNFHCVICSNAQDSAREDAYREIVKVTAINGDTLTIVRSREDTGIPAKSWLAGDKIYNTFTAEALNDINIGKIAGLAGTPGNANKIIGVNSTADGWAYKTAQSHIVDADGSLSDITTKYNDLLAKLENLGLIATS